MIRSLDPRPGILSPRRRLRRLGLALAVAAGLLGGPAVAAQPSAPPPAVIPAPLSLKTADGVFVLRSGGVIVVPPGDASAHWTATWLADLLARTRGVSLRVVEAPPSGGERSILLRRAPASNARAEAYDLETSPAGAVITAPDDAGLFYGAVTLWQLASETEGRAAAIPIAAVRIADAPRFGWRGVLLDSARHFQSAAFVEKFIDAMAVHKLNVLHWHLTDDQGWRLEIKKYPRLTEVGAWRVEAGEAHQQDIDPRTGKPRLYGGFYTQDQVREIVAYAAQRHVTIVPEIDMPGHETAAIAAYPELASVPNPPRVVPADWGVYPNLVNTDEGTIRFFQDVLGEVIDLFPSPYIHIGGDEAVKDQWKASPAVQAHMRALGIKDEEGMQSWFTAQMDAYLSAHGRRLVGWDDILKGGLSPNATVMSWRGPAGAVEASALGHDAIMAVDPTLYLDHRQNTAPDQPPGRGAVLSLEDVHGYDVAPASLSAAQRAHILGVEGAVWTEHIRTERRVEFMTFPRAAAIAELGWSPNGDADWPGFLARMPAEVVRMRMLDVDAADSAFEPLITERFDETSRRETITLRDQTTFGDIRYSTDGAEPGPRSPKYEQPLSLPLPARLRAATFDGDLRLSHTVERSFDLDTARTRDSHELKTCEGRLDLSLEDDAPVRGRRAVFLVDILDPCWIYPNANLDGVAAIAAQVGQLPFNYRIGDQANQIRFRPPETPQGELEVRLDRCDGERIAVLPLAPAAGNTAVTALPAAPIAPIQGRHDLCFTFTQKRIDPLWVIKAVSLEPNEKPKSFDPLRDLGALFQPKKPQ